MQFARLSAGLETFSCLSSGLQDKSNALAKTPPRTYITNFTVFYFVKSGVGTHEKLKLLESFIIIIIFLLFFYLIFSLLLLLFTFEKKFSTWHMPYVIQHAIIVCTLIRARVRGGDPCALQLPHACCMHADSKDG